MSSLIMVIVSVIVSSVSVSYLWSFHSVTSFNMLNNINGHVKGKASLILVIVSVIVILGVSVLPQELPFCNLFQHA